VPGRVVFDQERCKGCEVCVQFCPRKIIVMLDHRNARGYRPAGVHEMDKCTGCATCAQMCPDSAIEVYREPAKSGSATGSPRKQGS
jgi:2-oxoglutarate ferredoxin oxidoreductase subunit delta